MEYNIYFDKKTIKLSDRLHAPPGYKVFSFSQSNVPALLFRLESGEFDHIMFYHPQPETAWKKFLQFFDIIRASGGVVVNEKGEVLFIYRRGLWDLPKGKIMTEETPETTALREVKEECGLNELKILRYLQDTYHVFWEGKRRKMKITHWFLMYAPSSQVLMPEKREGIEKVEWLYPSDERLDAATFNNIKEILKRIDFSRLQSEVKEN